MSVVMLIWTALFLSSVIFLTIKKSSATRAEASADSRVTAELADALTNIINVKTFAQDRYEQSRFNKVSNDRYIKRRRSWMLDLHIRSYRWFMVIIFIFTYLYLSIYLVVNGYASVSIVLAAQLYMIAIYQNLFNLNQTIMRIGQHLSEAVEMTDILDERQEVVDPSNPETIQMSEGKIDFKDVRFRYAEAGNDVFSQLDITIAAGEKVGLVGHSGSGKTTLTRLLLRFLDIDEGSIEIDGQDISRVKQEDLRSHIAYVPQEPILFHRTLMENIRYGRLDATDEEIYQAAKNANATEFIDQLPDGYKTLVGERGMKLSGGQKQRVAIARAMLVKAPILLLDEATSALDSKSEKLIADALDNLMKNRTTIVIAHRLSTIRKLDRILVLKDGEVVEAGTHDELLMNRQGVYAELWGHQSGDFLDE
jgi:ATP-binding cassette subfamily B protein